jgi:hypothetical protein
VEFELGELSIEQSLGRLAADSCRHLCILYRQRAACGYLPVNGRAGTPWQCADWLFASRPLRYRIFARTL